MGKSVTSFLSKHLKGFDSMMMIVGAVSTLVVLPKVAAPIISQTLVDNVLGGLNPEWGAPLMAIGLFMVLFELILRIVESLTWKQKLNMSITSQSEMFWHAIRLPVGFYHDKYAGDIASRIAYAPSIISGINKVCYILGDALLIGIYMIFMIKYSAFLSIFAIIHIVINLVVVKSVHKKQVSANKVFQKEADHIQGVTASAIENIDAIKASSAERYFLDRWARSYGKMQNASVNCSDRSLKLETLPLLLQAVSEVFVLGIGAYYIMQGYLTVGMLMTFQSFMTACMKPVGRMIVLEQTLSSIKVKTERMEEVLDAECDVPDELDSIEGLEKGKLSGDIEIRNISFGYDKSLPPIIKDFSLHLSPGKSVAFVGASGSGKSTIAKMVSGLYKPWSGEILFDGKPMSEINREVFANSVAVVDQNIVLFDGPISDNVKMWDSSIEDFAMIIACHDAQIHKDIVIRKDAYATEMESGGKNFSGGQRQRLDLATAFVKEPSIMIMDEGTSALDAMTEEKVMQSIRNMGCSQIIIAHRLSTIRDCDEIIVLRGGKVEERGTHEQLMQKKGYYYQLVEN